LRSDNIKELYVFEVSADTVSNITNRVLSEVKEWQSRPLKSTCAVVFMDGMMFKIRKMASCKKVLRMLVLE
jgi:transposase-like protein